MDDDAIRDVLTRSGAGPTTVLGLAQPARLMLAWWLPDGAVASAHVPLGPGLLVERLLRHTPPQPVELERAIDLIEDELMHVARQLPQGRALQAGGDFAVVLAHLPGRRREDVEALFQRLASVSLGHPGAGHGLPGDAGFFASALLLRECMHHLGFETLG